MDSKSKIDDFFWIYGGEGKGKMFVVIVVVKSVELIICKEKMEFLDWVLILLVYFFCD